MKFPLYRRRTGAPFIFVCEKTRTNANPLPDKPLLRRASIALHRAFGITINLNGFSSGSALCQIPSGTLGRKSFGGHIRVRPCLCCTAGERKYCRRQSSRHECTSLHELFLVSGSFFRRIRKTVELFLCERAHAVRGIRTDQRLAINIKDA